MALIDLSFVSRVLVRLLEIRVPALAEMAPDTVSVSAQPPDQLTSVDNDTLGLYLYHVTEEPDTKNLPAPPGAGPTPVRYAPMGLRLYYQLTAHAASEDSDSIYRAQQFLGLALKTLHDFPALTLSTEVDGRILFDEIPGTVDRPDKPLRLTLEPVPHNEAVSFWSAGNTPLRTSAYYQASVILMEPDRPERLAGRVLSYGIQTFVGGAPCLDGSENTLTFFVPGEEGERQLKARPAQVPVGGQVSFTGVNLTGDETYLLLRSSRWERPQRAGTDWAVSSPTAGRLSATVQETIGDQTVLPGVYSAQVQVIERRRLPDGSERAFEHTSNQTPFCITPRIDPVPEAPDDNPLGEPDASGALTIRGYLFRHEELDPSDVHIYVGANRLERGEVPLAPGQFRVPEPPPGELPSIELRLPEGIESGERLPVRILINGVESPPRWIVAP